MFWKKCQGRGCFKTNCPGSGCSKKDVYVLKKIVRDLDVQKKKNIKDLDVLKKCQGRWLKIKK